MVIKLDMEKAYDKMSWKFIYAVLRKFGFSEIWIDIISRLLSNVWYSIIVNGSRNGFFTSSQGLKQGDPLSPSLFIIGSEVLSRLLNNLNHNENFTSFSMNENGPQINHLAYEDDVIIFTGGNTKSIKLVMKQIKTYERASGQKVNADKSFFITPPKTRAGRINRMRKKTGFMDKQFPFAYLGCPIYVGRKKLCYF